jgi:hypothetical protein
MKNKEIAINCLFTKEMNAGIKTIADELGITKSKMIRKICFGYLTENDILKNDIRYEYHI